MPHFKLSVRYIRFLNLSSLPLGPTGVNLIRIFRVEGKEHEVQVFFQMRIHCIQLVFVRCVKGVEIGLR